MVLGYRFLKCCNATKYNILTLSGYHLFFHTAAAAIGLVLAGVALYGLTIIVLQIVGYGYPVNCIFESAALKNWQPIVELGACTIIANYLSLLVINRFIDEWGAAKKVAHYNGDFIKLLIQHAVDNFLQVELSLRSGKSYVGFVIEFMLVIENPLVRKNEDDIVLIPTLSGYRKEETGELEFTTHYSKIILEKLDKKNISDFRIGIPMSEIVSARLFDQDVYKRFQSQNQANM